MPEARVRAQVRGRGRVRVRGRTRNDGAARRDGESEPSSPGTCPERRSRSAFTASIGRPVIAALRDEVRRHAGDPGTGTGAGTGADPERWSRETRR